MEKEGKEEMELEEGREGKRKRNNGKKKKDRVKSEEKKKDRIMKDMNYTSRDSHIENT